MTLPHITTKQQEILLLLYKFRFLNRPQIQTLLHHKNTKNINTWLQDLTQKNYLGKIINNTTKLNTTPYKYYISTNGIKFLKTQSICKGEYLTKLYKETKRSEQFIDRCLFIANIYLYLHQKYENTPGFAFYTQSDYTPSGIIKEIFPHCVFRKKENQPYFVVELFADTMPRFAIRTRIALYTTFFVQEGWTKNEQLPNILFICPDQKMEKYMIKFTNKIYQEESMRLNIFVTTKDQVAKQSIEGEIWKKIE